MEHPHSAASASSAAGLQRARAAGIELSRAADLERARAAAREGAQQRARAAGIELSRAADLERARAAAREGARRLPGILAKQAQSARRRRRLAQAIRMNYAAAMASDEATHGTRCHLFRLSTAADVTVSTDKAANAFSRTATDGCVTDEDVESKEAKVEAKVEVHLKDAAAS